MASISITNPITLNKANGFKVQTTITASGFSVGEMSLFEFYIGGNFITSLFKQINSSSESISYIFDADVWSLFMSSTTATVTVRGYYNNNSKYVSTTTSLTISDIPVISNVYVSSDFTDDSIVIFGLTDNLVGATVTSKYGLSAISSVQFNWGSIGALPSNTGDYYYYNFPYSGAYNGSNSVRVIATNALGNSEHVDVKFDCRNWDVPKLSWNVFRCDSNGNFNLNGGYFSITLYATTVPLELGVRNMSVKITTQGGSTVVSTTALTNGTASILGGGNISPNETYTLDFYARDKGNSYAAGTSKDSRVYVGVYAIKRIINVQKDGDGIAFGKTATANLLDSAWNIHTDGTVTMGTPLAVAQGGTGANTLANAQTALQIIPGKIFQIATGSSKTFTLTNVSSHLIVVGGYAAARQAAYIVGTTSGGTTTATPILTGSNVTVTTGTRSVTIAVSGGGAYVLDIPINGSIMTEAS